LTVLEQKFTNFKEVTKEIMREMDMGAGKNKGISPVPIVLKIFSPRVVNLSLIDLPGITKIPVGDQPEDIEYKIKKMIRLYIQNPNSLILAISPGNYDIANSDSLKLAREVDPEGERTLGVITKMDRVEDGESVLPIVDGKVYPLALGYVGVKCRTQTETSQGVNMIQAINNEKDFFKSHPVFRNYKDRMGVPFLTRKLSEYLVEHVRRCVPLIRQKLDNLIIEKEKERSNYGVLFDFSDSNTSKGALLISIINKYCKFYVDTLKGDFFINNELCGGAKINALFEQYKKEVMAMKPFEGMSDQDISISVRNVCGLSHSLIISDKAFEVLVKKEILKLQDPAFSCLNQVLHELKSITTKIKIPEFDVLSNARNAVLKIMSDVLVRCNHPTQQMLSNIFKIETGYINTKHPEFINMREKLLCKKFKNTHFANLGNR
jgi:replication fork clamp-binding protein CrfC